MSSSDSDGVDFDSDSVPNKAFSSNLSKNQSKGPSRVKPEAADFKMRSIEMGIEDIHPEANHILDHSSDPTSSSKKSSLPEEEIIAKHIRISTTWDPVRFELF